ncbi:ATP-dependent helicase, partial [Weissella cibaria]
MPKKPVHNLDISAFNNLPYFALKILDESVIARKKWQDKLQYIMVDEYQDVSRHEVELLTILQERHKNLFVVGDNDQTIYSFRGANVSFFMDFDKQFSPAETIMLLRNYRSGSDVLQVSNTLIKKNTNRFDKDLKAEKAEKGKVVYSHAKNSVEEAKFVADNIVHFYEQGIKYNDIAILYRAHHVSRVFEEQLLRANVPYRIFSGVGFYQRQEIKDILAYMRLIVDGDDISFSRVYNEPRRGIGPKKFGEITELARAYNTTLLDAFLSPRVSKNAAQQKFANFISTERSEYVRDSTAHKPSEMMMTILGQTGYEEMLRDAGDEERLDNLTEFKSSLVEQEDSGELEDLDEYLQGITLLTSQDADNERDTVNMMTIHTAKGLEFPVVFVVGLNEGIFPSSRIKNPAEMEEERRLAYVAYTRAESNLILTDSEGRSFDGRFKYPSRFIFDAERVGIEYLVELDERLLEGYESERHFNTDESEKKLNAGDVVQHDIFGRGVEESDGYSVKVTFDMGTSTNINPSKLSFVMPDAVSQDESDQSTVEPVPHYNSEADEFGMLSVQKLGRLKSYENLTVTSVERVPYYGSEIEGIITEAEQISTPRQRQFYESLKVRSTEMTPYYGDDDPIWQTNIVDAEFTPANDKSVDSEQNERILEPEPEP